MMLRRRSILFVVLTLLMVFSPRVSLASSLKTGRDTLEAKVVSSQGSEPIAHAIVSVRESAVRVYSDSLGRFCLPAADHGSYTLLIHHLAYRDVELKIDMPTADTAVIVMQPSPYQAGEVLVRSTRLDGAVNATPYPATVVMGDQLTLRNPNAIAEAVAMLPGVELARDGPWESALSIRGMKQSHIVSLIDGVRIETASDVAGVMSLVNMNDIERVELIKGGGSVLYGTGAVGGVVSIMTRRASFTERPEMHGAVAVGTSSANAGITDFLAVEGGNAFVAARLSGGYRNACDTRTPSGDLLNSQFHDFTMTGTLDVRITGNHLLELSYQRAQAEDTGIPGGTPFAQGARATYTLARRQLFRAEYRMANLARSLGSLTFRASYQEIARNVEVAQSPALALTPHAVHATAGAGIDLLLSPFDDNFLTAGIDCWQRSLDSRRERHNLAAMTVTGERPVPLSSFLSGGVYAQNEWRAVPGSLTVTVGGRYDAIRISNSEARNPEYVFSTGSSPAPVLTSQLLWKGGYAKNSSWSVNAGAWCACTAALEASVSVGTAFRSPSLEERFQFIDLGSVILVGNPSLEPERSVSLNGGFRLHGDRFSVNVNAFMNLLDDLVSSTPGEVDARPAMINLNVGSARLSGGEVSIAFSPGRWTAVHASVSYVRGEDTRTQANLPQIAPLSGQVELRQGVSDILSVMFSMECAAQKQRLAAGETGTPGYCLASMDFATAPLQCGAAAVLVHAGIHNLLDKEYAEFLSTLRGVVRSAAGRNVYVVAEIQI